MDGIYEKELNVAIAALQSASKLSQLIISSVEKGVTQKQDLSVVTIADFAVQALLIATFRNAFPNDSFVGEENASALRTNAVLMENVWQLLGRVAEENDKTGSTACTLPRTREQMCDLIDLAGNGVPGGPGSDRVWVFDPIDGTQNYVRGELYAINIGLLIDGEQAVGAVGCPNMSINPRSPLSNQDIDPSGDGCILYAVKGHGAFIQPMYWAGTLSPSPRRLEPHRSDLGLQDLCSVTCVGLVDSALDGIHGIVAERLGMPFPGSNLVPWVLRWAALAIGLANTTVWVYKRTDRHAKVWDHAGAMLLFEEAGGKVTDVRGKAIDWVAGRKMSSNVGFVAAPLGIHSQVLGEVQAVLRDQGRLDYLLEDL